MIKLWMFAELAATLVQAYLVVGFTHDFLGRRREPGIDKAAKMIMWFILAASIMVCNAITYFEGPAVIIFSILLFGYSVMFLSGTIFKKIIVSVVPVFCTVIVSSLLLHFFSIVFSKQVSSLLAEPGISRLILLILAQLMLFYLLFLILKLGKGGEVRFLKAEGLLILFVFLVTMVLFSLIDMVALDSDLSARSSYLLLVCIMGLVIINIVTLYLVTKVSEKNAIATQNQLLHQQLAYREQYTEIAKQQYQSTRRARHDLKQGLSALDVLLSREEYDRARELLRDYRDTALASLSAIYTQNETLNAIINIKLAYANSLGIKTFCTAPERFDLLSGAEICSVFGNLLDNAIEYCEKYPNMDSELSVTIQWDKSQCMILVANRLYGSVLIDNAELKSSKEDQEQHGIGVKSVREIIARHDGLYHCYEADGMFWSRIILFR